MSGAVGPGNPLGTQPIYIEKKDSEELFDTHSISSCQFYLQSGKKGEAPSLIFKVLDTSNQKSFYSFQSKKKLKLLLESGLDNPSLETALKEEAAKALNIILKLKQANGGKNLQELKFSVSKEQVVSLATDNRSLKSKLDKHPSKEALFAGVKKFNTDFARTIQKQRKNLSRHKKISKVATKGLERLASLDVKTVKEADAGKIRETTEDLVNSNYESLPQLASAATFARTKRPAYAISSKLQDLLVQNFNKHKESSKANKAFKRQLKLSASRKLADRVLHVPCHYGEREFTVRTYGTDSSNSCTMTDGHFNGTCMRGTELSDEEAADIGVKAKEGFHPNADSLVGLSEIDMGPRKLLTHGFINNQSRKDQFGAFLKHVASKSSFGSGKYLAESVSGMPRNRIRCLSLLSRVDSKEDKALDIQEKFINEELRAKLERDIPNLDLAYLNLPSNSSSGESTITESYGTIFKGVLKGELIGRTFNSVARFFASKRPRIKESLATTKGHAETSNHKGWATYCKWSAEEILDIYTNLSKKIDVDESLSELEASTLIDFKENLISLTSFLSSGSSINPQSPPKILEDFIIEKVCNEQIAELRLKGEELTQEKVQAIVEGAPKSNAFKKYLIDFISYNKQDQAHLLTRFIYQEIFLKVKGVLKKFYDDHHNIWDDMQNIEKIFALTLQLTLSDQTSISRHRFNALHGLSKNSDKDEIVREKLSELTTRILIKCRQFDKNPGSEENALEKKSLGRIEHLNNASILEVIAQEIIMTPSEDLSPATSRLLSEVVNSCKNTIDVKKNYLDAKVQDAMVKVLKNGGSQYRTVPEFQVILSTFLESRGFSKKHIKLLSADITEELSDINSITLETIELITERCIRFADRDPELLINLELLLKDLEISTEDIAAIKSGAELSSTPSSSKAIQLLEGISESLFSSPSSASKPELFKQRLFNFMRSSTVFSGEEGSPSSEKIHQFFEKMELNPNWSSLKDLGLNQEEINELKLFRDFLEPIVETVMGELDEISSNTVDPFRKKILKVHQFELTANLGDHHLLSYVKEGRSREQEEFMLSYLDSLLGITEATNCKSACDRTGLVVAQSVAMEQLKQEYANDPEAQEGLFKAMTNYDELTRSIYNTFARCAPSEERQLKIKEEMKQKAEEIAMEFGEELSKDKKEELVELQTLKEQVEKFEEYIAMQKEEKQAIYYAYELQQAAFHNLLTTGNIRNLISTGAPGIKVITDDYTLPSVVNQHLLRLVPPYLLVQDEHEHGIIEQPVLLKSSFGYLSKQAKALVVAGAHFRGS